jgi:hypothetical protein
MKFLEVTMKIYSETSLREFESWSGGRDTMNCLTHEQLDIIEGILEDIYPNGIEDTTLNDFLWFDDELIAEWLGFADFEELRNESCPFEVEKGDNNDVESVRVCLFNADYSYSGTGTCSIF